jgi:hypothetical protein
MFRLALAAIFALTFATPALAGDVKAPPADEQVAAAPQAEKPAPERRLTRIERWRGKPYLARSRGKAEGTNQGRFLVGGRSIAPLGFQNAQPPRKEAERLLAGPQLGGLNF